MSELETAVRQILDKVSELETENAQLLEALEAVTSSCTSSAAPMSEGQTRIVTAPSRDSLVKARAAIALAKGPKT